MVQRREVTATPNPSEVYPEAFYAGLSEADSAAVQDFVGFIETVNEGQALTRHFAVMAFGSSVAPKPDHEPADIDLKILHPGQSVAERARAVELIRQKIRDHLRAEGVEFEEADYTYSYTGSVTHDRYKGTTHEGGYGKRNEDPSFRILHDVGKPIHISISGDDRIPTSEHIAVERRGGDRPFSLLTPEVLKPVTSPLTHI